MMGDLAAPHPRDKVLDSIRVDLVFAAKAAHFSVVHFDEYYRALGGPLVALGARRLLDRWRCSFWRLVVVVATTEATG
jgi:hypothetical protein